MYPSPRSDEDQYIRCYTCRATDHWTSDCSTDFSQSYQEEARGHPSIVEPIRGSNQWNSQDSESLWPQTESLPKGQQGFGSSFGQSFGTQLDMQEAKKLPIDDGLLELLKIMAATMTTLQERTAQELNAHMTRIAELEKAKLGSDQIIEVQAKRIESLEEIVKKFEIRLKNQQDEQTQKHEANLRRINQIHVEVPRLREQLGRVDSKMCRVQQEIVTHIHSNYMNDSSDEEELDVITPREAPSSNDQHDSTSNAKEEPSFTDVPDLLVTEEEVRATHIAQVRFLSAYLARPDVATTQADVPAIVEFAATLKNRIAADCETSKLQASTVEDPMPECAAGTSCNACGLNCAHQLRACVNMIHVMPSMSKVKEKEIRALKRKTKRKLQRIWAPRGIFDVKELCRVDTNILEDQCAKSYMPRWKKRKRRIPPTNDSCD